MIFVYYGQIDVKDGAFVVVDDVNGERKHIPVGSVACIMLEPGTRISHAAVKLAAVTVTLLIWVGEAGVRLYSSGQPGGARSDKLLYQSKLALDKGLRFMFPTGLEMSRGRYIRAVWASPAAKAIQSSSARDS